MIRKARKEDAKDIVPLVFEILEDMELPILKEVPKDKLIYALEKGVETENYRYSYNHTYIYEVDRKVAGVIVAYSGETEEENDRVWKTLSREFDLGTDTPLFTDKEAEKGHYYIDTVSVHKDYRRQGIGKKLMEYIPIAAKENGQTILSLNCDKSNYKAQKLYEQYGFETYCEKRLSDHIYNYMIKKI